MIGNNPALLSYSLSKNINKQKTIRVLSLGTGTPFPTAYDYDNWSLYDFQLLQLELLIDIDVDMSHQQLELIQKRLEKKIKKEKGLEKAMYLRLTCETDLPMDKSDPKTIKDLIATGEKLYEDNTEAVKKMLEQIVEEKFKYFE